MQPTWPTTAALAQAATARAEALIARGRRSRRPVRRWRRRKRRLATADAAAAGCGASRWRRRRGVAELQERLAVERGRADGRGAGWPRCSRGRAATRAAEQTHDRLARELQAGDADGLRERLAIAERELAALEAERRRLDGGDPRPRGRFARGGRGQLGRAAGRDRGRARRRPRQPAAAWSCEGQAWRLLAERLGAADQSVRETLVAPIGLRLRPLLQRVFPGAEPVLDPERLSLTHLRRDGAEETFDSLSVGAREQLAVLVRLAFASLLAEREGEAPCLILDDALVYADEGRFETMKAILQRAARDMQILVLTCRPARLFRPRRALPAARGLSARHRPDAGNSAWTGPAAGVMVPADDEAERMTA